LLSDASDPRIAADSVLVSSSTERNGAQRLACLNAFLWSIGNGLVSTMLVVYLALEYGAKGIAISLILATPKAVGVIRLGAPYLMQGRAKRKSFCLAMLLASCGFLFALPILSAPGRFSANWSLGLLITAWSAYHLFEYLGVVALWSWLADMAPSDERGAFFGRRERMLTLGAVLGSIASGLFAAAWKQWPAWGHADPVAWEPFEWLAYAIPAGIGSAVMFASIYPLYLTPDFATAEEAGPKPIVQTNRATPLGPLLLLFAFTIWFALANGVSQAAQGIYPKYVLQLSLFWVLTLSAGMRIGQTLLAAPAGRFADRYGNRPLLIGCQLLVALGLCFYLFASREAPWWIAGAWLLWIAYVGLNVGLPNLLLKLAPPLQRNWWIAGYYALSGLIFGLSAVFGGMLFDKLKTENAAMAIGSFRLDHFGLLFLAGAIARALGVCWLLPLREPPQKSDKPS